MRRILFALLLCGVALAETTTSITGTIKDLTNSVVTSGKVTFTMQPPQDTTISGTARFTPNTVTCLINGSGQITSLTGGTCTVTMNTALQPAGTFYRVDVWPYSVKTSSFTFYAVRSSYDWSTVVPTTTTSPAQNFVDTFSNQTIGGQKIFSGANSYTGNISFAGIPVTGNLNGALNAAACNSTVPPSWCSGSDIGAWVNAAAAVLPNGCGEIDLPAGSYSQSTTILIARCDRLRGATGTGTTLTWTPRTGQAIIVSDAKGDGKYPEGAIEDLTLVGPGSTTTAIGVYLGGSDGVAGSPSTGLDPAANFGDHFNLNRVRIGGNGTGFGIGVQWGTNAWSNTLFQSLIDGNGVGIYFPAGVSAGSGERIGILSSSVQNNRGIGVKIGTSTDTTVEIVDSSLDFNGDWSIQNGTTSGNQTVNMVNTHVETMGKYIQNFGMMNVTGSTFVNGSQSGTLGYLIDNEGSALFTGDYVHNDGRGVINNPAAKGKSVWLGNLATSSAGTTGTNLNTFFDFRGNSQTLSMYAKTLNQLAAGQFAGTSACVDSTKAITFAGGFTYANQPIVLVFDETTKGGANLSAKSTSGFTVSCTGATDAFDWVAIGNPN